MGTTRAGGGGRGTLGAVFTREFVKRDVSFQKIADEVSELIGRRITDQGIIGYHRDEVQKPDPVLVAAIANCYGLRMSQLPSSVQETCRRAQTELNRLTRRRYAPRDSNPEPADVGFAAEGDMKVAPISSTGRAA